ncbi:MAG: hypothetical protein U0167_02485 [bacterium]
MRLALLTVGVVSILGQVVLLRELDVAFYGSELIYILGFGAWLTWTAIGVLLGSRVRDPFETRLPWLLVAASWALPLSVVLVREVRHLFGGFTGAYLSLPRQLVAIALSLGPLALLLGVFFQWAARRFVEERGTLARAYALESAGAMIGGALATLLFRGGVQNFESALSCALACACVAGAGWRRTSRAAVGAVAVTGAALLLGLARSGDLDRALTARNHPHLLATRDSPYGRVTLTRSEGQLTVFENDALAFETESTAAEELAHLAAIQHPRPETALILGGGAFGSARELLRHGLRRVDVVELNPVLLDLVVPRLPEPLRRALHDPAVRMTVADPRRFLDDAGRYDLILVGMPAPDSGRTNRFYSREFFRRCAAHLTPGGVLAFRLAGAENLWTPAQERRAASIHRALRDAFADAVVLPGAANVFLASDMALSRDPALLGARLASRGVEARLVIPAYVAYLYGNDRFAQIAAALQRAGAPANTDARPVCYEYTLLLWLSRFVPRASRLALPDLAPARLAASPVAWLIAAVAAFTFLLARRRPLARRSLLVGLAGFAGMVLETSFLLSYQASCGVLYQDLGLLLTLFMAGLAAGAAVLDARARRCAGALSSGTGAVIVALLVALAAGVAIAMVAEVPGGLAVTGAALAAAGALVAALFAYASLRPAADPRADVAPLYSSDLLGGCLGSLAASLFLVPAAGLAGAVAIAGAAVALGGLLV